MQEQADLAVKGAQAVPPSYMDRYFGQQLRRLQAKEDEIAQRAQDLVTKEKNIRAGKVGEDDGEAKKVSEDIKRREEEVRRHAEDLKRREDELRRRDDKLESDAKARAAALEVFDCVEIDRCRVCGCVSRAAAAAAGRT